MSATASSLASAKAQRISYLRQLAAQRSLNTAQIGSLESRAQAIEVEGYFLPYEKPPTKPTVLDVLGPNYHHRAAEIYIDNEVLEAEHVEDREEILRQGEEEKRKRRAEIGSEVSFSRDAESAERSAG